MNYWINLIIGLLFSISMVTLASPQPLNKIMAIVNDDIVLKSDVDNMLRMIRINTKNTENKIPNEQTLRHQILEHLIIDKIIIQIAEKMRINIPDQAIDMAIANFATQNGLTLDQLQQRLLMNGMNVQNYRSDVRKEMMIAEVRNNEVAQRIMILPQEVDSLVAKLNAQANQDTKVNLSHILIPLSENPTNTQKQLAVDTVNKIFDQLKQGADFIQLAITYSDKHNTLKVSNMSWRKIKELPTVFAQKIYYAKKGDIIGPIRSEIGFHILKLHDIKRGNIPTSFTEVKARHILIKESPIMNSEQALKKIQKIAQKIKIGQITFSEAAKKYSQDPNSALGGGELGWNILNVYDPAFRNSLMHLNKMEISQPIHSSFGWHLIQLEDTRQVDKTDVEKKNKAYQLLFNRKFNEEAEMWMQELRASAYVKILNDHDA
ncbi:MAG: peptidylprolyl isomerase SurA [Candidatus Arsenophonus melophagi]|nr:peptidylprolyl isomerase SurA [Candidatus Arsenophonus melophagi]